MRLVCYGDSIITGNDSHPTSWVDLLVSKDPTLIVENRGVAGSTSTDVLKKIRIDASKQKKTDRCIIQVGINDSKQVGTVAHQVALDKYLSNMRDILQLATNMTDNVLCLGLLAVDDSRTNPVYWNGKNTQTYFKIETAETYTEALRALCTELSVSYVHLLDATDMSDLEDGLHPNQVGKEKICAIVSPYL